MHPIVLADTEIHQYDGLYSLNDLHKASGGEDRHRPNYFMETQQTQELVSELDADLIAGFPAIKTSAGRYGGTYACPELVIAYAAWISPAFHLKVLRVFLGQMVPQHPGILVPKLPPAPELPAALGKYDPRRCPMPLAVGFQTVRVSAGFFCLADIHSASGKHPATRPSRWFNSPEGRVMLSEIAGIAKKAPILDFNHGGPTYAGREATLAYAAWISPGFAARVAEAMISLVELELSMAVAKLPADHDITNADRRKIGTKDWAAAAAQTQRLFAAQRNDLTGKAAGVEPTIPMPAPARRDS